MFLLTALLISLASAAQAAVVRMESISYSPKVIVIAQGESIIWKNVSYTEHSATSASASPLFDTGMVLPKKESKPVRFDKPGTYPYHCRVHGRSMSGVVTVEAAKK